MSNESSRSTFWNLISDNQIEIPVIQRDYAQGRLNEYVSQIRKDFIGSIISALSSKSEPLHLNFVYGRIQGKDKQVILNRNRGAIENVIHAVQGYASNLSMDIECNISQKNEDEQSRKYKKFIPLDGQQRLTTLFLLHWYFLYRINLENGAEYFEHLKGFKYKTRKSTTEFCEYLTETKNGFFSTGVVDSKLLSEQIEKSTNFFKIWKYDPSVKGMLVMLDSIHGLLRSQTDDELKDMWHELISNDKITFDFLDLDTLEQTDELYVKMNARGKHLTDFEHFKAWLQEYLKDEGIDVSFEKWQNKIDTKWLDLFWSQRDRNTYQVDDIIYNFFKSLNLFEYIVQTNVVDINNGLIEKIRVQDKDRNYIPFSIYQKSSFYTAESLSFVFKTLESLSRTEITNCNNLLSNIFRFPFSTNKESGGDINLGEYFLNSKKSYPSYWDRVYYYAFALFIIDNPDFSEEDTISSFKSWMRITRNLIYNTYIQNPGDFIDAVKSLKKLSKHKLTIEQDLLNDLKVNFYETQAKEEKRKLEYFTLGDQWKEKILYYENHEYFYGQLNFMFELLDTESENFELFIDYGDQLYKIFQGDIERQDFLFNQALLTKGDYTLVQSGSKHSFCKSDKGGLRARNYNWRKVFNDSKKLQILKTLLDDERDFTEIKDDFSEINWRKFIIEYPETISFCDSRFIDVRNELDVKLLKGNTYNGKHTDLYLFVLLQKLLGKSFINLVVNHIPVNNYRSEKNFPIIEVHHQRPDSKTELFLSINYSYNLSPEKNKCGFEVRFYTENNDFFYGFELSESNILFEIIEDIKEVESILEHIVEEVIKIDSILN